MTVVRNHIGAYIKGDNLALSPAARAAGTRNGVGISTGSFGSAVLQGLTGAAANAPTSLSVKYALQTRDGSDGANPWSALKDRDGNAVELEVTDEDTAGELDVDFQFIPVGHDEVRVVETVAFVDGAAPTVVSGALLVLGGSSTLPV